MNCDGVSNLLSAYLDGELSPGELLRVEEHLRRCHACADEVDSLRQTVALVASLEEVEVPASFQVSLHERLVALGPPPAAVRRAPAAPSWQRNVRRWVVPAAAAAAALAIGVTQLSGNGVLTGGLLGPTGQLPTQSEQVAVTKPPVTSPDPGPTQITPPPTDKLQGGDKPGVGQTPSVQPSNPVGPGTTDPGGNASTVTTGSDTPPVRPVLAPQIAYAFTVTVAAPLDSKTKDTLWFEFTNREQVNSTDVSIKVPPTQVAMDQAVKKLKEHFPDAKIDTADKDIALDIHNAEQALAQAKEAVAGDGMMNETGEKLAADQKAVTDYQANLEALISQLGVAVFTIHFQPAQ